MLSKGAGGDRRQSLPLILLKRFDADAANAGAEVFRRTPLNDAIVIMDDAVPEGLIDKMFR